MTIGDDPICMRCQHLIVPPPVKKPGLPCRAFPEGIPEKILLGDISHIENLDGDNGLKYKELSEEKWEARKKKLRAWQRGK